MKEKIFIVTTRERLDGIMKTAGSSLLAVEEPLWDGDDYLVVVNATPLEWAQMRKRIA